MKPVWQKVINIDEDHGTCMVESSKGTRYPVELNRLCNVEVGDDALVMKSFRGNWIMVDTAKPTKKYPAPLDVTEFPRDNNNCLNIVQHCKYLEVIQGMSESERVDYDNHLLRLFIEDYGMKNSLKHRLVQIGYEVSHDMEPNGQTTLNWR